MRARLRKYWKRRLLERVLSNFPTVDIYSVGKSMYSRSLTDTCANVIDTELNKPV